MENLRWCQEKTSVMGFNVVTSFSSRLDVGQDSRSVPVSSSSLCKICLNPRRKRTTALSWAVEVFSSVKTRRVMIKIVQKAIRMAKF